jgi:uncharacterized protein (TIGR02246 family)
MTDAVTAGQVAIRDLTARFTDAVNRRAPDDLAELFTEDGEWHVPGVPTARGRRAISTLLASLLANFEHLIQLTHSGHIDVHGDTATAVWYITERGTGADDNGFEFTGVYTDELTKTAQGWRFQQRTFGFLYRGRTAVAGRWYPHPAADVSSQVSS